MKQYEIERGHFCVGCPHGSKPHEKCIIDAVNNLERKRELTDQSQHVPQITQSEELIWDATNETISPSSIPLI